MPTSEAQQKATAKYKEKALKRIPLDVKKEEYERIKTRAEFLNMGINTYIKFLIKNDIGEIPLSPMLEKE